MNRQTVNARWAPDDAVGVRYTTIPAPLSDCPVPVLVPSHELHAYWGSGNPARSNRDDAVVVSVPGGLVLAIADGCTPTNRTPRVRGDGARYAANLVMRQVAQHAQSLDVGGLLYRANRLLQAFFGSGGRPDLRTRDRPQAAVAVVSLRWTDGRAVSKVDAARAADCEIIIRTRGQWVRLTETNMLTDSALRDWRQWKALNRRPTADQFFRAEDEHIGRRECWNYAALGRFAQPRVERIIISADFDELIVSTDGVDVTPLLEGRFDDVRSWVEQSRSWTRSALTGEWEYDDLAMLHVRRQSGLR